ncbi:MAG: sigma-70 family RNA polymerase sigma factor [Sedimentisphaerales bacterium]|nr:sigma-70 family RNA polymerase sigma factor [Sedimentisphaerales bacterium]
MKSRQKELLELLDTSGAELFALLARLTLREDVAEELMQDLFIKLESSRGLDKATNRRAYARRAAINLAFDWRRTHQRSVLRLKRIDRHVSNDESPLTQLIHSEELSGTLDALGQLKKTSREALVMRYIQQEPYERIAEQMGKTSHQVRAICSRAIQHLRRIVGSNNHEVK